MRIQWTRGSVCMGGDVNALNTKLMVRAQLWEQVGYGEETL